ncbi:hypothetical protein KEM48_012939 [Puccinia striiformis f. sp. tritici PST-130]|nr:hypothetical protein KEM48_012939 [Puccinia striiformis f. sp. tritici PST-130]
MISRITTSMIEQQHLIVIMLLAYYSASFASNSSVPTSEAHCGLSWNRSGIGPNHVFPSEDCLRNEDKLPFLGTTGNNY